MRSGSFRLATLLLVVVCGVVFAAGPVDVQIPGAAAPAIVERLASTEGLTALAIGPNLEMLAVAYLDAEKPQRSSLVFHAGEAEPSRVEIPGRIRDLLFSSDRSRVYGLLHKSNKRGQGETQLIIYEVASSKIRRGVRVPTSARSIDHWTARGTLLIAGDNEIRTLTLPDLRSGPLFRVLGTNLSLTSIGGGDLLLIGQDDSVILVGLSDPPGEDEMPRRAHAEAPGPVVALASSPDGSEALARIADGRLYAVTLDPLRLQERGTTDVLASLEGHDEPPRTPDPDPAPAESTSAPEDAAPDAPIIAVLAEVPEVPEAPVAEKASPPPEPEPVPPAESTAGSASEAVPEAAPDTAPESGDGAAEKAAPEPRSIASSAQVNGRIVGAAADEVVAVVMLGPDNLLREAARVAPTGDGIWEVNGLEPGRYRVQLDGGGGSVLMSEPPFLLLDVEVDHKLEAPEFRVRRAL